MKGLRKMSRKSVKSLLSGLVNSLRSNVLMLGTGKLGRTGTTSIDLDFEKVRSEADFNDLSELVLLKVRVPMYIYEYMTDCHIEVKMVEYKYKGK